MERNKTDKRLLIISCSKRKKNGKKRAWDVYDGIVFRMLKKMEREVGLPKDLEMLILSAKYGIIRPDQLIEEYDECITQSKIKELKPYIEGQLSDYLNHQLPREIFCCLGKQYLQAIYDNLESTEIAFSAAKGRIGEKLATTRHWVLNEI